MSDIECVQKEITVVRSELKNIRQQIIKLRVNQKQEIDAVKQLLPIQVFKNLDTEKPKAKDQNEFNMTPIGFVSSCFKHKNGTPRQPILCQTSKASLTINKTFFTNPEHSLIGLREFPYIWILFVFHKNGDSSVKAKVHPPRLNGTSTGVFSTRSPHRPCAIGLSLTKIEEIVGSTIFLSGVDMLDGTPVLDIKPYISSYDIPPIYKERYYFFNETAVSSKDSEESSLVTSVEQIRDMTSSHCYDDKNCSDKSIISKSISTQNTVNSMSELLIKPSKHLEVLFTDRASEDIEKFHFPSCDDNCNYCLNLIDSPLKAKQAISEVLQNDPRSVYRKNKCSDKLYFFEIDNLHITCWFDEMLAEVLRVKPVNKFSNCM